MATFDELLDQVMRKESGGNPNAVSSAGAVGLYQVMPATAMQYGVDPRMLANPQVNRYVASRYLADLLKQYNGNAAKAVEAYNAGPGKVQSGKVPTSTRGYTRSIIGGLEGTAYAGEPKGGSNKWQMVGAPMPVDPSKRWQMVGAPTLVQQTPEQQYEGWVGRLPPSVRNFIPSTMGQAGMAAGTAVGTGAVALAPETFGTSMLLGLPLAGALAGGAAGNPKNAFSEAAWEGGKAALGELGGALVTKGTELGARFAFKNRFLNETARRIGDALPQLFSNFPLSVPKTAQALEDKVASGDLTEASGKQLGEFRDFLKRQIPAYQPGTRSQLVNASAGVPFHYTAGTPAVGRKFVLPDIAADGKTIAKDFNIEDAIDHVRSLQSAGWSTTGTPKSAQEAWLMRQTAHSARETLISQLNAAQKGLGDTYADLSGDYGTSVHLQKIFKQSYRPDGQLDQAALLHGLRNEIDDINKFKGFDKGLRFRTAVAPERGEAIPETSIAGHLHGGLEGMRGRLRIPHPYYPESRKMIPQPWRALTSKQTIPVIGLAGQRAGEYVMEGDEESAPDSTR